MTAKVGANVWHCSRPLRAEEGRLSAEKWASIAQDFVDEMGFTEASGKAPCRRVTVRHGLSENGNDHVHIAVILVREAATKATTHHDFKRAQNVCRDLEMNYGFFASNSLSGGFRQLRLAGEASA